MVVLGGDSFAMLSFDLAIVSCVLIIRMWKCI